MLIDFFLTVREAKVPVSLREFLDLNDALRHRLVFADKDEFYYLSRLCLVKDERHYDKFDKAFSKYFEGVESIDEDFAASIPDEWMQAKFLKNLSEEDKKKIEAMGGFDELMETFRQRLAEQEKRHEGGNKMIGTGGTSPFGNNGYNPEGIRIGQKTGRNSSAVKVWDKRNYKDLDDSLTLGIRNLQLALRKLRRFAREGASDELDLDGTIASTAKNGGYLDINMRPERHNKVKVLLFFDIGGSMDPHVRGCEELFSACRSEFKQLEYFYFHNCIYENIWRNNIRRTNETTHTWDLLHKYGPDYKVIIVGDASMAPYEVTHAGGSIEHWNEEAGAVWLQRLTDHFRRVIWLNPMPEEYWGEGGSLGAIKHIFANEMYPMTLEGLERAIRSLNH